MMIQYACVYLLLAAGSLQPETARRDWNFETEIVPVLTKAGCNAGACHGAAAGRGNFHLSLFGSDPAADYEAIVQAFEGRRVNRLDPQKSLILRKPLAELDHGGGMVLEPSGPEADRMLAWIQAGAPRGNPRRMTSLRVTPLFHLCDSPTEEVPISVRARFDDGEEVDVTPWAAFAPADLSAVSVDGSGVAKLQRRGQHVVIVRYLDRVVPVQLALPFNESPVDLSGESQDNDIDGWILDKLAEMRIPVSPPASESEWIRRATLDLTGRLPTPQQIESFLLESSANRRGHYVDQLLNSDAFTDYWTWRMARLLRMHSLPNERAAFEAYLAWLRQIFAGDEGLDSAARQLLTATGDSHATGPANFSRMVMDARQQAELVGDFFAGIRIGCANCHNHPNDRWTQEDYHGMAAVFARVDRSRNVRLAERGEVTNPRTGTPATPRIPGLSDLPPDGDHRAEITEWLLSEPHQYFARATVNRLWAAMFGRGLVSPTDDLRETNPPTHPELLASLVDQFVAEGYRIRPILRRIALSRTYARSSQVLPGNAWDDRFYSRAYSRPLEPEVLIDAISVVTGVANEFPDHGVDRAIRVIDASLPAGSLDALGRCRWPAVCGRTAEAGMGLSSQLHLLNGEVINQKIDDRQGRLQRMIEAGDSSTQIVAEFFLRGFARQPRPDELARWEIELADEDTAERRRKLEDFVWSLLNSREFRENR